VSIPTKGERTGRSQEKEREGGEIKCRKESIKEKAERREGNNQRINQAVKERPCLMKLL
jgi:hypothetical protein